jgi:hypothetical protein
VLGARGDVDVHAGEGQSQVAPHRDHRVDGVVTASVEEADPGPGQDGGEEAPGGGDIADHMVGGGGAPPGEAMDGPVPPAGDALQSLVGIGGTGIAHCLQEGDVFVPVGVSEAGGEIDPVVGGEGLDRLALPFPPQVPLGDRPGQVAVLHLQARTEDVLDVEVAGHGLDLVAQRRRSQDHGVPLAPVGGHQGPGLRVDEAGDPLLEQPLAQLLRQPRARALTRASYSTRPSPKATPVMIERASS